MPAKIAVIYYSTYGHVQTLAKSVIEGAVEAGAEVTEFQFPETLPSSVLEKMHAAPKSGIPVIKPEDMTKFDGFLLGFPTRYGRAPAQVSSFFDATGAQWASGALAGKLAGIFVCTAGQHGGQETTAYSTLPILAHHGMTYVPLGYCDPSMYALDVVNGGSAWGASTLAGGDGSRQVTDMEKNIGKMQGSAFAKICARCAPQAPLPSESRKAKIAVISYSTYGHIAALSQSVVQGLREEGAEVTEFQIGETLPEEVLAKMHAPPKSSLPVIQASDMVNFDGFLFGIPTRYGRASAQVSTFFDSTGQQWASGALRGKFAGVFTSTAGQHGGQETTTLTTIPFFTHHAMNFVPLGYADPSMYLLSEAQGGSPWGASTLAGGQGERSVSDLEKDLGSLQGKAFARRVNQWVQSA